MLKLTNDQKTLIDEIVYWYKYDMDEDYVYTGAAGTGKTTVISYIIDELKLERDEVLYVAYTGKAASVLMQKGFDASTIHSAFFDIKSVPVVIDGKILKKNDRIIKKLSFVEKEFISPRIKLIVLDEWSMVNEQFRKVIYKFGIPVIASGDKYQLKPIFGESPFAKRVKFELKEITRQAKDSGIIQLATLLRKGEDLPIYYNFNNSAHVLNKKFLQNKHLLNADIILTSKNKTRDLFNDKVRSLKGSIGKLPNVGDKLVCRKNNWSMSLDGIPLVNGILGTVINPIRAHECDLKHGLYRIDFQPDYVDNMWEYYEALLCDYNYLIQPCGSKEIDKYNNGAKMEFAEAITVHLSQGSQYSNVVYWDEWMGDKELMNQLRYTAVTRATESVYMFI